MKATIKLIQESKAFIAELQSNGGTLGGYAMRERMKAFQNAIKNAEKEVRYAQAYGGISGPE